MLFIKFPTKLILSLFSLLFIIISTTSAQTPHQKKQIKTIQKFVDAYNQQNFSKMKKTFIALVRVLPIKKQLKQSFEPHYNKFGMVKLGEIQFLPKNRISAEFIYLKDTTITERDQLNFVFNKHRKLRGIWFMQPDFLYLTNSNSNINTSDQIKAQKIDNLLKRKFANGFNGNVIVVNNGNVIYKNALGYTNYNTKELLNDSSVFELASCSKQFTAMAIMILVEQGKLKYTDDVKLYVPDLPYEGISIENLLTHTGGLPDYMSLFEKHWDKKKIATNQDIVALFKQYKPKPYYKPNETYDYSNTGYALLSLIIEKASGLTYPEFLDKNIFKPLGMRNSYVYNTRRSKSEKPNNYAYGYIFSDKTKTFVLPDSLAEYNMVRYLDAITGDGTVNTSILDLVKWDKALRENRLVSKATTDKAFSKYKLKNGKEIPYGYGQQIAEKSGKEKLIYHGGSWPGYLSMILHFEGRPIMIAILMNNEYENIQKLADQIAKIILE